MDVDTSLSGRDGEELIAPPVGRALQPSHSLDDGDPALPPPMYVDEPAPPETAPADGASFARVIGTATGVRLAVDTSVQVFNPFLSLIAAGLGTSVIAIGRLISLRASMGLFAPLFGALTARWGYRRTIRLALTLIAGGVLIIGLSPNVWSAALGMIVMGLGTGCFTPLLHAYLSGRLPYSRRAQGLGIVEYSWALTGIVGLLLVGLLIEATNWRVPFFVLAAMLIAGGFVVMRMPPTVHAHPTPAPASPPSAPRRWTARVRGFLVLPGNVASTWGTIVAGGLNYFAAMQVMIIYGAWLTQSFGLGAAALGRVAFVFGWFDLTASVAVSLFTDRLGKRPAVITGAVVAVAGYLAAAWFDLGMIGAIALVGVARMGFEFAIVSYFPLLSEQQPGLRSKIMTLGSAFGLLFSTASGFTSPWLFTRYGMQGVVLVSAVATMIGVAVLVLVVREGGSHGSAIDPGR